MIRRAEYPGKMIGGIVTDTFGNLTDFHLRVYKIRYGICHAQLSDKGSEV